MPPRLTRRSADRHRLYEDSVQCPEADVAFIERVYRARHDRRPRRLREDFCGTALLCCEWVRHRRDNVAVGVDLDADTLRWAREHHLAELAPDERRRVRLVHGDVLQPRRARPEVVVAYNFSYFTFRRREELLHYFRTTRRCLSEAGVFILDVMGGPDAQTVLSERRRRRGFTYEWDQASFDPISHHMTCHIHFHFPDGSHLQKAFSYEWRLWTLPELRDLLAEAGFASTQVFWENTDRRTGRGNGVYRKVTRVDNEQAWIALLAGYA